MKAKQNHSLVVLILTRILIFTAQEALCQAPFVEVIPAGDLGSSTANFGASWGDYDGDGDVDLYLASSGQTQNHLYRNHGGGVFTVMSAAEVGSLGDDAADTHLGLWADFDNDGDLDLYVANFAQTTGLPQSDVVYFNEGDGRFIRYAGAEFSQSPRFSNAASLADFDQDGLLDVLINTRRPDFTADRDVLYHSEGNRQFSPVSSITASTYSVVGSWADVDGDGDLDLIAGDVAEWGTSYLYVNGHAQMMTGTFSIQTTLPTGIPIPNRLGSAAWGDFDNDGDLDLLCSRPSLSPGLELFRNDGAVGFIRIVISLAGGGGAGGVAWLDADNDGDLDLLVGTVPDSGGTRAYVLLENKGPGVFEEYPITTITSTGGWRGPAVADFDDDGFMDFFIVVTGNTVENGRDQLWRNTNDENHWLKLVLKGTESNASAIGAVMRVKSTLNETETWQMRQVFAGGQTTFVQHDPRPNFGLGNATVADVVRIEWPSGTVQELSNVVADQILTVIEPPRLKVESGGQLSWPVTADGYRLESAPSINGPWAETSELVQTNGSRKSITIQPDGGMKFFRLSGQ